MILICRKLKYGVTRTMAVSNYERVENISRGNNNPTKVTTRLPIVQQQQSSVVHLALYCRYSHKCKMNYDISWIIPKLRRPTRLWNFASSLTVVAVGIFSKIITQWLNKTTVFNKYILEKALDSRPKNVPLITVSNHHSCFDDPGIWGTLDIKHLLNRRTMRWSLAAHDICFTNVWHSYFFMLGKCVPTIRGNGVYQEAINFCIEKLGCGEWVHVFPEGKVNMFKENIRLKWGIGRLIMESPVLPLVIPIYHIGMDEILPNEPPYMIRTGKKVTCYYGKPIDFGDMLKELRRLNASETQTRKAISDKIDEELQRLKTITEDLHVKS